MNKDVIKDFEENYLPEWCHKKHLPKPKQQFTEHWQLAWVDYIKEVLNPEWESIRSSYLSMDYKVLNPNKELMETVNQTYQQQEELQQLLSEIQPETEQKSDWEIVQEMLKNKRKC